MNEINGKNNSKENYGKILFAIKPIHLVLLSNLIVSIGLIYFWHNHHYGTNYIVFFRYILLINDGFFATEFFMVIFKSSIYISIIATSYCFLKSLSKIAKFNFIFITFHAYSGILLISFFIIWVVATLRTSSSYYFVIRSSILGLSAIVISWVLPLFFFRIRDYIKLTLCKQ